MSLSIMLVGAVLAIFGRMVVDDSNNLIRNFGAGLLLIGTFTMLVAVCVEAVKCWSC